MCGACCGAPPTDARIKALVIEPSGLEVGWAKLQELRADIESFKKSGKPVIAYLRSPGTREYYLATACTKIYMAPEDLLNLKGMRFELMYFKKTLDKLGVGVQVEHAGKYKDFGDMFTRTNMSQETKRCAQQRPRRSLRQPGADHRRRAQEDAGTR